MSRIYLGENWTSYTRDLKNGFICQSLVEVKQEIKHLRKKLKLCPIHVSLTLIFIDLIPSILPRIKAKYKKLHFFYFVLPTYIFRRNSSSQNIEILKCHHHSEMFFLFFSKITLLLVNLKIGNAR